MVEAWGSSISWNDLLLQERVMHTEEETNRDQKNFKENIRLLVLIHSVGKMPGFIHGPDVQWLQLGSLANNEFQAHFHYY